MEAVYFYCAFFALLIVFQVESSRIRRIRSNLVLYSGYSPDQKQVMYTNSELEDWTNLTKFALETGLELTDPLLLCGVGNGAWLAYPKADYQTDPEPGHNFVNILIGDVCISAEHIESVQPVGPVNKELNRLLAFPTPYLGSEPKLLSNHKSDLSIAEGVASLITLVGYFGEWLIEGNGKKYCLSSSKELLPSPGACIIPDLATELGIRYAKVTVGCGGADGALKMSEDTVHLQMPNCFRSNGAYKIHTNHLRLSKLTSIRRPSVKEFLSLSTKRPVVPTLPRTTKPNQRKALWKSRIKRDGKSLPKNRTTKRSTTRRAKKRRGGRRHHQPRS